MWLISESSEASAEFNTALFTIFRLLWLMVESSARCYFSVLNDSQGHDHEYFPLALKFNIMITCIGKIDGRTAWLYHICDLAITDRKHWGHNNLASSTRSVQWLYNDSQGGAQFSVLRASGSWAHQSSQAAIRKGQVTLSTLLWRLQANLSCIGCYTAKLALKSHLSNLNMLLIRFFCQIYWSAMTQAWLTLYFGIFQQIRRCAEWREDFHLARPAEWLIL